MVSSLSLGAARALVAEAERCAAVLGVRIASAVLDRGGQLIVFSRMDGTQLASSAIAQGKAYTAVAWERPSHEMFEVSQPGESGYGLQSIDARFVFSGGGVPLRGRDGELMGAIGVSGGTADQDRECAENALAAWSSL